MEKKSVLFIVILCLWYLVYAYLSINIILPALPELTSVFNTSKAEVQLSITSMLLGYAFSQVIWGILSDRYGRRCIIIVAILITVVGSFLSAIATSVIFFIIARLIEGIGSGFGPSMARVVAKDAVDKKKLHATMTYMISIIAFMPAIAPIIGGEILEVSGWRSILFFLAGFGILLFLLSYFYLPETISKKKESLSFKHIIEDFKLTFINKKYLSCLISYSLIMSGLISYYILAPYIFISTLKMNPSRYGLVLVLVGFSYMISSFINGRIEKFVSKNNLFIIGYLLALSNLILILIFYFTIGINEITVLVPGCMIALSCGFISPTANSEAMASIKGDTGVPISLLGAGVMVSSSIVSTCLAYFLGANSLLLLFCIFLSLIGLSFIAFKYLK